MSEESLKILSLYPPLCVAKLWNAGVSVAN